ncbi:putative WRKY transcription factor 35 [Raphanus sativus]|nr:putative WRKY transcription factor 35 [Raphanus sativus]
MDNFQGDLTDVVRGIGSRHMTSSPGPPEGPSPSSLSPPLTSDFHVDFPSFANSEMNPFGDPFVSMTDPLLNLPANFSGAGDSKSNNSFAVFPNVTVDDHIKSQCSVFPRIRISQRNIIQDASKCNSPAMATSSVAAASPWGMISVDSTNSPRNCLLVDNHNITSSSSQIQISSSPQNFGIKRRKGQGKKVVCIPAPAAMNSRSSGEVVPSDLWAWRKYGQNPSKVLLIPDKGYYRCSSSKGCPARKQVERSRTDPNMLVITYTSEHNHPWPTQRNALAGSTRSSSSSSSNPCSKSATATTSASSRVSQNKDEPNKSHLPFTSTSHVAKTVKEEDVEKCQENIEFDDVDDTYRPEFQHHLGDFFADLDDLEEDFLTMLCTQGFSGDNSGGGNLDNKRMIPDVFSDFFDDDSSRSL